MAEMTNPNAVHGRLAGRGIAAWLAKWAVLTLSLVFSAAIFSSVVGYSGKPAPSDGPLTINQALWVVNGVVAAVLGLLAAQTRLSRLRLGLFLFLVLFGAEAAMLVEAFYYIDPAKLPQADLVKLAMQQAMTAAVVATTAAALFRGETLGLEPAPDRLVVRLATLTVVYVVLYYAAGYFIAWQSADVRAFYGSSIRIEPVSQLALQLGRGLLWALLSLYAVRQLRGPIWLRAVILAVMFVVMTDIQLLYPSATMPWVVRRVHMIEMGVSEAAYGLLAAVILLAGTARERLSSQF